jgi:ABC-type branched-subunit amino acid transport system substrate-binding protein
VNGRRIVYRYLDDAYNPATTVQQVRKLVQEDQVFAVFNSLGTEHNLAVRPYLNQAKVPQLFVASGGSTFGNDYGRYPWTTPGFIPNYVSEGRIYGRAIGLAKAGATVAVLYQNDDYGKEVLAGLDQGLRFYGKGGKVVASESYELTDPDVASQVAKLAGSKADFFLVAATPKPTIQAFIAANRIGWKPRVIVNAVSSASSTMQIVAASTPRLAEGTLSLVFLKDPNDPAWRDDAGIKLYRSIMARYGKGSVGDVYNVYAMAVAHELVTALRAAGRNVTRASLVKAVTSLDDRTNPFVLPDVRVRTTNADRFAIKQGRMQRWATSRWIGYGPILSARGSATS